MSKKKIPDYTLVNNFELTNNSAKQLFSPQVDTDSYLNVMNNPPHNEAPGDFNWFSNAYYDWNLSKNEVDRDTELGDYIMANEDYRTLLQLKEYLQATQELEYIYRELQQNPNNQELLTKFTQLTNTISTNEEAYIKASNGDLNTESVAEDLYFRLQKGKESGDYSPALSVIDFETQIYLKPGQTNLESSSQDNNIYNRRIISLENAKRYNDRVVEYESKMTSDYYNNNKEKPGMDLTDIDTYLFKVPGLMGSSASSMGRQIIGTISALFSGSKFGGPIGSGLFAASSIGANMSSRDRESKAEVYQNYKSSVQKEAEKLGIDKQVIKEAQSNMEKMGVFTPEQMKDINFIYDQIISDKVPVDNVKFDKIRLNNLEGIRSLYMDNMALSGSDIVQQAIEVAPIGSMAKAIRGFKPLSKALDNKTVANTIEKVQDLRGQLTQRIDDVTKFGLDNIDKLPKVTKRKAIVDLGGRILVSSALEGAEEGVQYIKGQRYINRDFDPDPNLAKSFIKNLGTGARSIYAAITPWDPIYSDDQEFLENFKGGALLGGIMTGAVGGVTSYSQVQKQLPADQFVSALYAERLDIVDRVRKNIGYGKMIRENRWDNVINAFDELENSKIDGIDTELIRQERKRAELIKNVFTSNTVMRQALSIGIDPRTQDYDIFVALKDHYDQLLVDAIKNSNEVTNEEQNILYSPEVQEHIDKLLPEGKEEDKSFLRQAILYRAKLDSRIDLAKDYNNQGNKLQQLEKNTRLRTSKSDVFTFEHLLNKDIKQYEKLQDQMSNRLKEIGVSEDKLEIPKLHQTIRDLVDRGNIIELDRARAEQESFIMNSNNSNAIMTKINKWKDVQSSEEDFVQKLNDLYSGKLEQQVVEDGEVITPGDDFQAPPVKEPSISQLTQQDENQKEEEDPQIIEQRQRALENISKFFTVERDFRGDAHNVLDQNNAFGQAYKSANNALEKLYKQINPKAKRYSDYSASVNIQSYSTDNAELWEDLYNLRNQLEEEVYANGASETANSLVEQIRTIIDKIDSETKQEDQANEQLQKIKEKEKEVNTKIDDTTPAQIIETVDPTTLPKEEDTQKVDDLPTLGQILGGLIGDEAASKIDQPTVIEQSGETSSSITQSDNELTYDQQLDPYSHELNYRLTTSTKTEDGKWIRVSKKYQGMEQYLNNEEFSKISAEPDFISEVTKNGVRFEIKPYNNGKTVEDAIYVIFNYKSKEYIAAVKTVNGGLYNRQNVGFNRLPFEQQQYIVNNLNDLRNKILEFKKVTDADPNMQIVPTIIRTTSGRIVNEKNEDNSPKNRKLTDSAWLSIKDPYKITPQNTEVGITTGPRGNNIIRLQNRIIHVKDNYPMGKPVWIFKTKRYDGSLEDKFAVLNYKYFKDQPKVADLILDLILSKEQFYKDATGKVTNIEPLQLLKFIVNFGTHTIVNPNDPKLNPEQIQRLQEKQFYIDENNNIIIGLSVYTADDLLTNKQLRDEAKKYIMDNFHYNIDEDGLNKNYLGGSSQSQVKDPHFYSISSFLKNSDVDQITIIPGEIEFTLKDFGLIRTPKGIIQDQTNPNGISVLGWYIKQGILMTDIADQLYDANIYIDDVQLVNKNDLPNQKEAETKVQKAVEDGIRDAVFNLPGEDGKQQTLNMADIYQILDGKKRKGPDMQVEGYFNTVNIPNAITWLQDTLGITPDIVQSVIDITQTGANVVGRVTEDSILISEIAPEGVEYHEAWHRVSQLCISDKSREKIYNRYNKKHKSNLNEKQLDEIFAEQFKEFMLNESTNYAFDTKNWFKRILDFIKLWARTGQYALAKIYYNINIGKYRGITPNESNINRFRQIYSDSGPNLEINGYKFKNIVTYNQFDNIVKSLTYAFFQTSFTTGKSIDYVDIKKEDLRFDTLKMIVQAQASKFPSPVLTEILDNFDSVFAPTIVSKLKSFGIRSIDANENITDIEEGAEKINIGQHTVEGMNISIKDNAPAEVKFFFQTIPVFEGTAKNANAKIDPYTKFPMFVDPNKAWNKILKDLAGCRTISNILDKIVILAKNNDPFYQALLMRITNLIAQSNSADPKVSINAEALLTKIETVITSDINNFITVKVGEDENGFTSMKLIDNTVDVKAITYPKVWSQSLFINSGIFKYDDNGIIIAQEGAKKKLKLAIDILTAARTAFLNNKGIYRFSDRVVDLHQLENQEWLKDLITQTLQSVGILIDKPTINKMLLSGDYGDPKSSSYQLLNSFIVSTINFGGISKIISTLDIVNKAISNDGHVKKIMLNDKQALPTQIWNDLGFIKHLANYYAYVHATDKGLSSYGPDGNSYYLVSQNNFVKDRVNEIITDKQVYDDLNNVTYNKGSILLDAIGQGNRNISVETLINFKDNTSYDAGRDYFGITSREDYLAKMAAVFENRLIFPTVADKKTYHFIRGINLPHEPISFNKQDGKLIIRYGEDALNVLIGYCQDELNQIELCLRQIDDNPDHYIDGVHYNEDGTVNKDWLEPSRRIKNFHTPNKYNYTDKNGKKHTVTLEGNGARFLFLTGIYTDKGFVSFNDPKKTAYENLQTAKDYFFNTSKETQMAFLSKILNERMKEELKTAKDMGLIDIDGNKIWSIQNKLLDENVILERTSRYIQFDPTNAQAYAIFDMLSDYLINSIISVNEIEKVFSGSPAYYKVQYDQNGIVDLSVDKIKRLGSLTSTGINNRLDFYNDPLREEYTVAELKDHEIQDKQYYIYEELFTRGNIKETIQEIEGEDVWNKVKDLSIQEIQKLYPESVKIAKQSAQVEVAGYKSGINVADAAVYISPDMTRDLLRMRGEWSPEIKQAFEILTNPDTADKWDSNPELYAKANKVVLNAMKYVAFGTRFNEIPGLGIPYFNKMALFPLFKSVATGDIKALYDRMVDKNNPVDMILFDSAVKAGSRDPMKAYRPAKDSEIELKDGQTTLSAELTDQLESGQGTVLNDFNNLTTYTQKFKYLRQQLATDPHTHEESMAGTQFMKVNLSNIRMNDMYGKDGEQVSGQYIKDTVMSSLNRLSHIGKQELQDKLFTEDGQVNITALGEMLLRDARESNANDNVITGLATKDNAFTIPLSALSDNKWIESRFISMINKAVIDVHMPGGSFIQRSAFGLEATSNNVITPNMINDGIPLKMINEEGSMDAVVSINLFKHFIPDYEKMTFREARKWLIKHNIIGQNTTANAIGYRIPTQSVASISPLRFVDVFPEIMGDTIMLPEGFTKLTGSDFDIDKLYVARFGYDENGIKYNDDSPASIKNDILDAYLKVLLTKDNTNSLKLSIDNATENVKKVLKDIESNRTKEYAQPFKVYTPSYQEARKEEYTGGKAGIGPFALNNAHHILTQLTNLKMEENAFTIALDIIDLDRIYDYPTIKTPKGGRILDWLSAMINGFVDIAKDPYIVRLNINSWTYNMVSFLLRTGKGAQTFYFIGQPILKEMAQEVINTKGKYGIDRTKTPSQLEKEAIEKVLDKYDPTSSLRKKYTLINSKPESAAIEYANLFKTFVNKKGEESSSNREMLLHPEDYDTDEQQIRIYYAWLALKPYADDLANLVKYSKIDTKKTGKTFAEQWIYYQGMMSMLEDSHFGEGEVGKFYTETFIQTKTLNSIPFGNSIFSNLLFRNTNAFSAQKNNILSLLGRKTNADSKLLNAVISGMEAQIKSDFFNEYIEKNNIDTISMFKGKHTIAKRVNKFKMEILSGNPNYSYLLNSDGTINNDFLNYIIPNINNNELDFLDTSDILSADQADSNNLINYWRELLDDPKPEIKRLARDIAVYAFLTSGDNPTMNNLFQYLPNSYRKEMGYVEYVQSKLDQLSNGSNLATYSKNDLFLNNWTNDKLVKPVEMYYGENNDTFFSIYLNEESVVPNIILGQRTTTNKSPISAINWVTIEDNKYPLFPPYIKINDKLGNKQENWHVYTLIGFRDEAEYNENTGKFTGRILYTPLYGLVSKKGYKGKSNGSSHTILEYGVNTKFEFNKEKEWNYREALNNTQALVDMASDYQKDKWEQLIKNIHPINELPSYQDMNWAKLEPDKVFVEEYEEIDENDDYGVLEDIERPTAYEKTFNATQQQLDASWDINNTENTVNDPINYNDTEQSIEVISSDKTILTNKELIKIRPFTGDTPRIAVASEHTDPVFFSKKIIDILDGNASVQDKFRNTSYQGSDFAALYLITKHDGLPLKNLLEYKIPKLIHFSITGLGGTIWEPGVMKYNDLLDRIESFIKQGLDPEMVTVRIDPIVPGVTKLSDVENIVKRSSEMGIKNIRFSVMDQYSTTKKFMEELGYDYSKYYDNGKLHARPDVLQRIENRMLQLKEKYGVKMSTCAEPFNIAGISKEACLSVSAINNMLGTSIPETMTGKQRALCSCYGGKTDLLRYDNKCASSCIYCYAHHNNNKNLNYYNEDGTLKDNPFTRTGTNNVENTSRRIYSGTINKLKPNEIFVFGSNTQGRHGKGAALTARNKFGAIYGQAEGRQGQSYAIITKDLTKQQHPSRTKQQIIEQINRLYDYARQNPNLDFIVAYSGTGGNLNAYSNEELANMFANSSIPNNIIFESQFSELVGRYNKQDQQDTSQILTGIDLMDLYDQGDKRIQLTLDELEDLTPEERQTYRNEFVKQLRENNVNNQDKLEEAIRKFICNL